MGLGDSGPAPGGCLLEVVVDRHGRRSRGQFHRGHLGLGRLLDPLRIAVHTGLAVIERLEADLQRGRVGLEAIVVVLGIHEQRIGDDGVLVIAEFLPSLEIHAGEGHGISRRVEVAVVVDLGPDAIPGTAKQGTGLPVHDVVLEREGKMVFDPSRRDLRVLAADQDVVADHVLFAVVLVEAAGLGVVDQVVLHRDAGTALVGIQSPAAVGVGVDVVEDIVADDGAFGRPQRVDAAHVAQHAVAQVMDVVETDAVVLGEPVAISPTPAGGNAGVVEVGDVVVGHRVVAALSNPDADGRRVDPAAMVDDVVVHRDVMRPFGQVAADSALADANTAGAEVGQVAVADLAVLAAAAEPGGVVARVQDLAVDDRNVSRTVRHDGRLGHKSGLVRGIAVRRQWIRIVLEREPLQRDMFDKLLLFGFSLNHNQFLGDGSHDLGLRHVLSGKRHVVQRAFAAEEPLAGRVQRRFEILEMEARVDGPAGIALELLADGNDRVGVEVDLGEESAADAPLVEGDERDVVEFGVA